jgi:hypothetical protein
MSTNYKRIESVVTREIAGETMLIPITSKLADMQKIFSLDDVSSFIWDRLDGEHGLQDIVTAVTGEFDVTEEVAVEDTYKFLAELCDVGLVEQV